MINHTKIVLLVIGAILSFSVYAGKDEMVKAYQGSNEPTAKDALWMSDRVFMVAVFDDGSSRNGYAQYVCSTMEDYGISSKGKKVRVMDILKIVQEKKWVELGEARCR